jgi:hypothetical protein
MRKEWLLLWEANGCHFIALCVALATVIAYDKFTARAQSEASYIFLVYL